VVAEDDLHEVIDRMYVGSYRAIVIHVYVLVGAYGVVHSHSSYRQFCG